MNENDPYRRLRPAPPTPPDELCACADAPPLMIQGDLGPNPVACARCNLEVPPERLGFSAALADALASWASFHDSVLRLWLDSAEYEAWAEAQLADPASPVTTRGRARRAELGRPVYFWWFVHEGELADCPVCQGALVDHGLRGPVCEACAVLVHASATTGDD